MYVNNEFSEAIYMLAALSALMEDICQNLISEVHISHPMQYVYIYNLEKTTWKTYNL
jgi:hypothetical protein